MYSFDQNIHGIFKKAFEQKPSKTFVDFGDSRITYGDLKAAVGKYTTYFKNVGLQKGNMLVFSSSDEPFVCLFTLSLIANGITGVFLDPEGGAGRSVSILKHCDPDAIYLEEEIRRKWHLSGSSESKISTITHKSATSVLDRLLKKKEGRETSFPALVKDLPQSDITEHIDPESDALIMFTSGTTSAPKGVRMSHRAIFSHMASLANVYRLNEDSRLYNNLMLSHTDGMTQGPLLALFTGISLFRPFPFSIQKIEDTFDVIYREKITHWVMVPTMITLIHQFKEHDNDTLGHNGFCYVISCGGMLEVKIWSEFENKFATRIINGYGLTETIAGGLFAGPEDDTHIIGTIGKPVDCEAKVVDDNGDELPSGEKGELWMRGSLLMSGYYKASEANAEVFSGDWLRTGDLSYKGEDDCFRIVGRKKSAIVTGGVLVIPEEVTEVLNTHPGILESVTFAIPDEIWGEMVVSAIVLAEKAGMREEDVMEYCRQHLEPRKIPSRIFFMDILPRGRSGKVMLPQVKKMVEDDDSGTHNENNEDGFLEIVSHSLQIPEEKLNLNLIAEETPEWDSIRHLVMIADLEKRYNISFSSVEVMNIRKLSELSELVERKMNE